VGTVRLSGWDQHRRYRRDQIDLLTTLDRSENVILLNSLTLSSRIELLDLSLDLNISHQISGASRVSPVASRTTLVPAAQQDSVRDQGQLLLLPLDAVEAGRADSGIDVGRGLINAQP
jgi:hypothetical protein